MFPRELAFFIARSRFPDGHDWLRINSKLANGIAVILQLIQRVLPGAVRGNAAISCRSVEQSSHAVSLTRVDKTTGYFRFAGGTSVISRAPGIH